MVVVNYLFFYSIFLQYIDIKKYVYIYTINCHIKYICEYKHYLKIKF